MITYEIKADRFGSYALYNKKTGNCDHASFNSMASAIRFFNLHFGHSANYKLDDGFEPLPFHSFTADLLLRDALNQKRSC